MCFQIKLFIWLFCQQKFMKLYNTLNENICSMNSLRLLFLWPVLPQHTTSYSQSNSKSHECNYQKTNHSSQGGNRTASWHFARGLFYFPCGTRCNGTVLTTPWETFSVVDWLSELSLTFVLVDIVSQFVVHSWSTSRVTKSCSRHITLNSMSQSLVALQLTFPLSDTVHFSCEDACGLRVVITATVKLH